MLLQAGRGFGGRRFCGFSRDCRPTFGRPAYVLLAFSHAAFI
jgi:hypothetical protein